MPTSPSFDLGDGTFFNSAFAVYMHFRFFHEVLQMYIYWLMAKIKGAQKDGDIARSTGILRSWESIGSTIAYAVGATRWSNENQMILGFVLWVITLPCTLMAVFGDWNVEEQDGEERGEQRRSDESDVEVQNVTASREGKE